MASIRSLFTNIKGFKIQTMNISDVHRLFVLFLLGIVSGTMVINIFGTSYVEKICIYGDYLVNGYEHLRLIALEKWEFFTFCMRKYLLQVVVLVFLNLTSKARFFNGVICIYKGAIISVLICASTILYGSGGLLLYITSILPHYFIYVPLYIYSFYFAINFKKILNNKHILTVLKGVGIEVGLVAGTSFLEAFVNLPMIINIFQ